MIALAVVLGFAAGIAVGLMIAAPRRPSSPRAPRRTRTADVRDPIWSTVEHRPVRDIMRPPPPSSKDPR